MIVNMLHINIFLKKKIVEKNVHLKIFSELIERKLYIRFAGKYNIG